MYDPAPLNFVGSNLGRDVFREIHYLHGRSVVIRSLSDYKPVLYSERLKNKMKQHAKQVRHDRIKTFLDEILAISSWSPGFNYVQDLDKSHFNRCRVGGETLKNLSDSAKGTNEQWNI